MKRYLLLSIVAVLVLANMAAAAPPNDFGPLPNHIGKSPVSIPIYVTVEKFAHLGFVDTTPMEFTLTAPSSTGDTDPRLTRQLTFATNTPIIVEIAENISEVIYNSIPEGVDIKGLPFHVHLTLNERTPISGPNFGAFVNSDRSGAKARFAFDQGYYSETVVLGYGWNAFPYRQPASDRSWDEYSWWLIGNNTYTGSLTITISAVD